MLSSRTFYSGTVHWSSCGSSSFCSARPDNSKSFSFRPVGMALQWLGVVSCTRDRLQVEDPILTRKIVNLLHSKIVILHAKRGPEQEKSWNCQSWLLTMVSSATRGRQNKVFFRQTWPTERERCPSSSARKVCKSSNAAITSVIRMVAVLINMKMFQVATPKRIFFLRWYSWADQYVQHSNVVNKRESGRLTLHYFRCTG